jgi:hypothetical protein
VKRAGLLLALALALPACGGGGVGAGSVATTVQRYDAYPPDTISVSASDPRSLPCRRDAAGLAHEATLFVEHEGPYSVYPADLAYVVLREELADFQTRRCDLQLLGHALANALTPAQRRVLLTKTPHVMSAFMRRSLAGIS